MIAETEIEGVGRLVRGLEVHLIRTQHGPGRVDERLITEGSSCLNSLPRDPKLLTRMTIEVVES